MSTTRCATIIAGVYLVVCSAYILISSNMAADAAASVDALRRAELVKGFLFVVTTAAFLFVLTFLSARRLAKATEARIRAEEAFLAAHRRSSAGLFAATVAHDFKNVLTVLGAGVQELKLDAAEGAVEVLDDMGQAVRRGSELADRLAGMGRPDPERLEKVDVDRLVGETVDFIRLHTHGKRRRLVLEGAAGPPMEIRPGPVTQTVTNLVINAIDATGEGGQVVVRLERQEEVLILEVHDDGPGIPEDARARVLEPFHTTKDHGTGLGLVSALQCAQGHGGSLEIDTSPLGGACIRVRFRSLVAHDHASVATSIGVAMPQRA